MKNSLAKYQPNIRLALLISIVIALPLAGYVAYEYRLLNSDFESERNENIELNFQLEEVRREKLDLLDLSRYQQSIIDSFQGQITNLGSTVGTLEKLAQTDKELLKKYSKVFFLSENYVPAKLTDIGGEYIYDGTTNFLVHADVWPHLKSLLDAARADDIELLVASAFRSFDTQSSLKSEYKVIYGAGTANQFSADQGYSEHQLGTAVDLTTPKVGGLFSVFQLDPAYKWLKDNAHKYGFVLSYPDGNSYYKFEPWHWRFVGIALATFLHNGGKYFYDLDQREIDAYLIKLFD
jgi:LAS superfamily LD-carboxypeptidase LdcB